MSSYIELARARDGNLAASFLDGTPSPMHTVLSELDVCMSTQVDCFAAATETASCEPPTSTPDITCYAQGNRLPTSRTCAAAEVSAVAAAKQTGQPERDTTQTCESLHDTKVKYAARDTFASSMGGTTTSAPLEVPHRNPPRLSREHAYRSATHRPAMNESLPVADKALDRLDEPGLPQHMTDRGKVAEIAQHWLLPHSMPRPCMGIRGLPGSLGTVYTIASLVPKHVTFSEPDAESGAGSNGRSEFMAESLDSADVSM